MRRRFAIESREGTKIGPVKAGVGRGSLLRAGLVSPVASPMGKKEARERALATLSDGDDERRGGDAAAAGTGEYSRGVGSFAALGAATLKREEGALGRETMLDAAGGTGGGEEPSDGPSVAGVLFNTSHENPPYMTCFLS